MFDNCLYIIGNGFDLHHGIPSSYASYQEWLKRHDYSLYVTLEQTCTVDFLWSDFERALSYINRKYFLQYGSVALLENWNDDDYNYADLLMPGDATRELGEEFWHNIQNSFRGWCKTIKWTKTSDAKKLRIDTQARFITFNYTTFLESHYGIPQENILYIHGKNSDYRHPPIIGHDGNTHFNQELRRLPKSLKRYYLGPKADFPEIEMLTDGAETFLNDSKKPVDEIIRLHQDFFDDLYDIEHIYILGHSLSNVDLPYLQAITQASDYPEQMKWHVSYYSPKEEKRLYQTIRKSIAHQKSIIESFKLSDIQIKGD